jgi:hypothetical protein
VTTKRSGVQTETWCAGETLAMSLTWGCRWLVRLGVLFFAFNTYTYVILSFIEVGESKFIRLQWKRLFPCAVHVSLLRVRSHVICLITVFSMFANQTLGEYSMKTYWSCVRMCNELLCQNRILLPDTNNKPYVESPW